MAQPAAPLLIVSDFPEHGCSSMTCNKLEYEHKFHWQSAVQVQPNEAGQLVTRHLIWFEQIWSRSLFTASVKCRGWNTLQCKRFRTMRNVWYHSLFKSGWSRFLATKHLTEDGSIDHNVLSVFKDEHGRWGAKVLFVMSLYRSVRFEKDDSSLLVDFTHSFVLGLSARLLELNCPQEELGGLRGLLVTINNTLLHTSQRSEDPGRPAGMPYVAVTCQAFAFVASLLAHIGLTEEELAEWKACLGAKSNITTSEPSKDLLVPKWIRSHSETLEPTPSEPDGWDNIVAIIKLDQLSEYHKNVLLDVFRGL